jgi:hypothetical protein
MKFGGRNTFRIRIAHPLRNSRVCFFLLCFTDCLYNLFRPTCAVIVSPSSVGTHNNCAAVIEYLSFCFVFFLPPCIVRGFLFVYYSRRNNRYTRGVDVSVNRLWKILHEQRLPPVGYLLIPVIVIFFFLLPSSSSSSSASAGCPWCFPFSIWYLPPVGCLCGRHRLLTCVPLGHHLLLPRESPVSVRWHHPFACCVYTQRITRAFCICGRVMW